ncbi:ead/Ea22-like family protein [Salmonella enterica]|nr:ead/Ea22-like family protein [Salmonella enterica]
MSNIDKQALRERYSPKPVPKCHICGEEMTIQRISASRITYGCTGEGNDGYFKFGRTFADEHYEKSRVTVVDVSEPDVLALLDELEAAEHAAAVDHEAACSLVEENEELKRRIAELEAREVMLPDRKSEIFWPGDAAEFDILGYVIAVNSAIRAAGIKVKGERDG